MRTSLELADIAAIGDYVIEKLRPLLSVNGKASEPDIILDKKTLASYMKISESTINKLVSDKRIPHFKISQGQSGGVRFNKRDIDKWISRQTIPEIETFRRPKVAGR